MSTREQPNLFPISLKTEPAPGLRSKSRTAVIRSLLQPCSERLLDIGCGPITPNYAYRDTAQRVTCVDWKLQMTGVVPSNIECLEGDFTALSWAPNTYDSIIAADVFEHVLLEQEPVFVSKCVLALKPRGNLVISVPHRGTFAFLDPYQVKPTIQRALAGLGLYHSVHNGCCDIRKGHKHYTLEELTSKFAPLQLTQAVYFGYFFDPLFSWAVALSKKSGQKPSFPRLQRACQKEGMRDYGQRSFNVAVSFYKPPALHPASNGLPPTGEDHGHIYARS